MTRCVNHLFVNKRENISTNYYPMMYSYYCSGIYFRYTPKLSLLLNKLYYNL